MLIEVLLIYDSNVTRYLNFLFYKGVEWIYSVVFISGVWQNDSGIHIHIPILLQILSPYRFSHTGSLCQQQVLFDDLLLHIIVYIC